jgi:hypothetical protein
MRRWLLELGFDVEQTDKFGSTALIQAVESGDLEAIGVLVRAGARIDRQHNGSTALGSAQSREAVLRLLAAGADPQFHRHRATLVSPGEIRISGGVVLSMVDGQEQTADNDRTFVLDIDRLAWRELAADAAS